MIIFPCSGRKIKPNNEHFINETFTKNEEENILDLINDTKSLLITGRGGLSTYIDTNSIPIAALDRYNGFLYTSSPDFRNIVKNAHLKQDMYILIMSGGYGLLTPSERIFYYNKKMDAKYWNLHGLPKVIENYITNNKITHVFGFFSVSTDYLKIMNSIDWQGLKENTSLELARAYYINFQGTGGALQIVPQTTGALITSFIKSNFNEDKFYTNPFHEQFINFIDYPKKY